MEPRFLDLFPEHCSLLLSGPPGVGKLEYLIKSLSTYLHERQKVIFVCVDMDPREVMDQLLATGIDPSSHLGHSLQFIDCYTPSISDELTFGGEAVIPVSSFSNLEGIGMAIGQAAHLLTPPVKVLFYTISTLFLHNSPQSLSKFIQIISARVKMHLGLILYASHEGVNEERQETLTRSLVDGVLELRFDSSMQRSIRLHHLRGQTTDPKWYALGEGVEAAVDALSGVDS